MEEPNWIKDNLEENVADGGEFEATLFMSTDNKHTVSIKASTPEGRKAGLRWAKAVYEKLKYTYGTKQEANVKTYQKTKEQIENPEAWCEIHKTEMRQFSKNGKSWYSHNAGDKWCSGK
jgi:hypothetical protein